MSELLEIVVGVAVVAYVIGRQLIGEPLRGKRVVILPIVLTVIGVTDLTGSTHPVRPIDVAFLVVGAVIVAGIGLALGLITRLESRNGALWGQLPATGLWLWLLLVVSRVVVMAIANGADAKVAASTSSILLMLGINRLAQAAVILPRAMSAGTSFAPEKDGRQLFAGLTDRRPDSAVAPVRQGRPVDPGTPETSAGRPVTPDPRPSGDADPTGTDWSAVGRQAGSALAQHHRRYEERHDRHHDRRYQDDRGNQDDRYRRRHDR